MAINSVTRSDFIATQPNQVSLPTFSNFQPAAFAQVSCTLPADALPNGIFAFTYITDKTHESSVDIEFQLNSPGTSWGLATNLQEFRSMHWAVGLTPGQKNTFTFNLIRGGTIVDGNNVPHPFGGAGTVLFQNIFVLFQRADREQELWRFCSKCRGLFFGENVAASHCPVGGQHDPGVSGDYHLHLR